MLQAILFLVGIAALSSAACVPDEFVTIEGQTGAYFTYHQFFKGSALVENTTNPGNKDPARPPITNTLPYGEKECKQAVANCAQRALDEPTAYISFDLHWLKKQQAWRCIMYAQPQNYGSRFNVKNRNVAKVYGYSSGS